MKPLSLRAALLAALFGASSTTAFQSIKIHSVFGPSLPLQRSQRLPKVQRPIPSARQQSTLPSTTTTALRSALLSGIDALWKSSPYAAAAIVCGVKASAADFVAQQRQFRKDAAAIEKEEAGLSVTPATAAAAVPVPHPKVDKLRNLAYLIYGAVYQGITQEYVYNHLYPAMFGSGTDVVTVLTKVCFDLFIQTIFLTLPIAYLSKALIFRYSAKEAFRRYVDDIRNHGLLTKYFALWGPVQCLTFSIVPEHFRVTFIAAVSFFWLIILSSIASKKRPVTTEDGETLLVPDDCPMEDGLTCKLEFKD